MSAAQGSLCAAPDCGRPARARGYCGRHYMVARRAGEFVSREAPDPCPSCGRFRSMSAPHQCSPRAAIESRFWAVVDRRGPDQCWEWNGYRMRSGYGQLAIGRTQKVLAHRLSMQIAGHDPTGWEVCHRCDNPPCVNPAHLFLGTHADNMADATRKGRLNRDRPRHTHCRRGHEFTPDNVISWVTADGRECRTCRTCANARRRRRRAEAAR